MARLDAPLRPATRLRPANHDTPGCLTGPVTASSDMAAALQGSSSSVSIVKETLGVDPSACTGFITRAPVTCSTDCSNQVVATDIVNEVHDVNEVRDATTAIFPKPAIDPNGKAVKQLTPAISADVDPKSDEQAREALTLAEATTDAFSRLVSSMTSEAYHIVNPSDLAAPTLAMCSTRPMPWPSLVCSHELHVKHARLLSQVTCEVNWSAAEWWSVISSVQSSYEVRAQENVQLKLPWPSFLCDCRAVQFLAIPEHISELPGSFSLEKTWSKSDLVYKTQVHWKFSEHHIWEHAAVGSFPRPATMPETIQTMNMLVQWKFLNQEEFLENGRFGRECSSEQCDHHWALLPHLMIQPICCCEQPFSCLQGTQRQSWRPPDRATFDAKQTNQAGYTQVVVHETSCFATFPTRVGYLTCLGTEAIHWEQVHHKELFIAEAFTCLRVVQVWQYLPEGDPRLLLWPPMSPENLGNTVVKEKLGTGSYNVLPTVEIRNLQPTELPRFPLPPARPPDNHDKCILISVEIQHMILVSLCFMDRMASTETLEKCGCQHLMSTKTGNLLLDKGCLKCHITHGEIDSKMLQSSGIQCVQPTNSVTTYLKLEEVCAADVHMFEKRTFQDWGLLLYFHQRPPVQHWVIPTYASIQIGGTQCKCVCTAPCLFGKWLVKAGSSQNGKVIYQTSMEYLWKESVIGAMTMTFPVTLTSNLCPAGGIIFTSYGPLISSRNCAQLICLDSTTYVGVLPDQITPLYSARTVDIFGDPLSTTSPLTCHRSIAKGAQIVNDLTQYPYTCFVPDNTSLELTDECLLTDLVMGPSCTVPYIIPAVTSNVLDLLNASPSTGFCSRHFAMGTSISLLHIGGISFSDPAQLQCVTAWKIYSRLIPARVATLLGSKLASNYHLEQLWDPGGNALSVWISQSLEEIVCCRGMLVGGQNSVDAMEFSSRCDQVSFQGGRDVLAVAACFAHGSVDGCNNYYFLGISFDLVAIVHDYYSHVIRVNPDLGNHRDFELVKDHQVQWDPGGSRRRRLGVKPNFKERRMLRALLPSPTWAGPWTS